MEYNLEMTKDEARALLEAMTTERARLRKFVDRRQAWGKTVSPKVLADLVVLDRLVATLKGELK